MEILVCVKRVPDTSENEIEVNRDGSDIQREDLVYSVNEWDNYAVEEAIQIRDKVGGSITVVTVGDEESEEVLRREMAMGADSGILLSDAAFENSDGKGIAEILKAAVEKGNYDLFVLPLENGEDPFPFRNSEFDEGAGQFSPDMRWIAYQSSDEIGVPEIYVGEFSPVSYGSSMEGEGMFKISEGGGLQPRWGRDGQELYYQTTDAIVMVVEVADDEIFKAGTPEPLFQIPLLGDRIRWDVTSDGNRFYIVRHRRQIHP